MARRLKNSGIASRVKELGSMSEGDIFGHTVWYSMRDANTRYDDFDVAKNAAGIVASSPKKRSLKSAFLKAMAALDREARKKGFLVRKLDDTQTEINFILVSELKLKDRSVSKGDRLKFATANVFTFDKGNVALVCERQALSGSAKELYEFYSENMISKDIRTWMIDQIKDMNAIMLRPGGGIYFVPEIHTDELVKLESFVGSIGSSVLLRLPVRMTTQEKKTMGTVAISSLTSELNDLHRSIPDDLDKARPSTVKSLIAGYGELKAKALYYSTAFEISLEDLNTAMDAATKRLSDVVGGPVAATKAHKKLMKKNKKSDADGKKLFS